METKQKMRRVLDVTNRATGEVTRMTYQKFYNHFGYGDKYARYNPICQNILRGKHATYNAIEVEEPVPDKATVLQAKAAAMQAILETPIALAVAPLKNDAIARAEQYARMKVAEVAKELEAAGNDLKVAAPYPKSTVGRAAYIQAYSRVQLFRQLTKWRKAVLMPGEPELADINPEYVERFVAEAKKDAAFQYEAYVAKLVGKIGKVTEAKLEGNYVWSHSELFVTKLDGTKQCWRTQMILNVSKLGKVFNQFPTRQIKM